jgi:hypothetical protein
VSGFADTAPMPDYAPDAEINRRVTVLLKMKESLNSLSDSSVSTLSPPNIHDPSPN